MSSGDLDSCTGEWAQRKMKSFERYTWVVPRVDMFQVLKHGRRSKLLSVNSGRSVVNLDQHMGMKLH